MKYDPQAFTPVRSITFPPLQRTTPGDHSRAWLALWEAGWSFAKIADAWTTRTHPITPEHVEAVLDKASMTPLPAPRAMPSPLPPFTIGDFQALAKDRGWSEQWLVEQCKCKVDNPRDTVREILAGKGMTKPRHTNYNEPERVVDMTDTALVWSSLLNPTHHCACGCGKALRGRQRYATSACQRRDHRLNQRLK